MKVKVSPKKVNGSVVLPPSKSMAHRAVICASLAKGKSIIQNIAYNDDIIATLNGMEQLGAKIERHDDYVVIEGIQDIKDNKASHIHCNESGSTLRFLIPIFSLCEKAIYFYGKNRLLKRPQKIYEEIFQKQGLYYQHTKENIQIQGALKADNYELDGNISSQFISGLLFALPLLNQDSTIHIKEPFESRSYVDLTIEMLKHFGVDIIYQDFNTLYIKGNQQYQAKDYIIEGDYSQLGFFAVLAAINNDLDCLGLSHHSKQGDKQILPILENMGITIETLTNGYRIKKGPLHGCEIDLKNCPDLGPILCVLAMYAKGVTRIYNAKRLRYKESDRIAAMESELKKLGVNIQTSEDEIIIQGKENYQCKEILSGHKDHRIVMSLCVAATCFTTSAIIDDAEAINKSYPTFFDDLSHINGKVEIIND